MGWMYTGRCKADQNQARIVRELRQMHFQVISLGRVGNGVPDLLIARNGRMRLVELKREKGPRGGGGGRLTADQFRFHAVWSGPPIITARTTEEILAAWSLDLL